MVASALHGVAEVAIEHAHHGFDLPALAVVGAFHVLEEFLHQPPVLALRRFVCRPTDPRRDHAADAEIVT